MEEDKSKILIRTDKLSKRKKLIERNIFPYRFLEEPHYLRTPDSQIQLEMRRMDTSVTLDLIEVSSTSHKSGF